MSIYRIYTQGGAWFPRGLCCLSHSSTALFGRAFAQLLSKISQKARTNALRYEPGSERASATDRRPQRFPNRELHPAFPNRAGFSSPCPSDPRPSLLSPARAPRRDRGGHAAPRRPRPRRVSWRARGARPPPPAARGARPPPPADPAPVQRIRLRRGRSGTGAADPTPATVLTSSSLARLPSSGSEGRAPAALSSPSAGTTP